MMTSPLRHALIAFVSLIAAGLAWASEAPEVVNLGDGTYSVTVAATHKFTRNTAKLKVTATAAATDYCAKLGKQAQILSVDEKKSFYGVGDMARTTVVFKPVDAATAGAPAAPAYPASYSPATAPAPAPAPMTNEALYADLLRLDDLRKKGILTEEEFAAEKQKVLARSK